MVSQIYANFNLSSGLLKLITRISLQNLFVHGHAHTKQSINDIIGVVNVWTLFVSFHITNKPVV